MRGFFVLAPCLKKPKNPACIKNDPVADPGLSLDKGEAVAGSTLSRGSFKPVADIR